MRANDLIMMMRHAGRETTARAAAKVRNVERNAPRVLHRLDRPKRIDVGKADQLERGGWSEGLA